MVACANTTGCLHANLFYPCARCWLRPIRSTMRANLEQELPDSLHPESGYCELRIHSPLPRNIQRQSNILVGKHKYSSLLTSSNTHLENQKNSSQLLKHPFSHYAFARCPSEICHCSCGCSPQSRGPERCSLRREQQHCCLSRQHTVCSRPGKQRHSSLSRQHTVPLDQGSRESPLYQGYRNTPLNQGGVQIAGNSGIYMCVDSGFTGYCRYFSNPFGQCSKFILCLCQAIDSSGNTP